MPESIRSRYAPSPTGRLHLGNLRTALLVWLDVRARGGTLLLRMEDLDKQREVPGAAQQILDDLHWLGLDWDEGPDIGGDFGPYTQSKRFGRYEEALHALQERNLLYPCICSRKDLSALDDEDAGEDGPRYPGTCAHRTLQEIGDRPHALRFRAADEAISFTDRVQGEYTQNVQQVVGDFVVRRKDTVAAYQLAVVLDDIAMGVTDVVRGADLLGSTPRQMLLYRALGKAPPRYGHVPLMLSTGGEKFAKRERDVCVGSLRAAGRSAGEVVGFLAHSAGLAPNPAPVRAAELVAGFSLESLERTDTRVDPLSLLS